MSKRARQICVFVFALLMAACTTPWTGEARAADNSRIAIIVSSEWRGPDRIDARVLRRIFLGKVTVFAQHKVAPIQQAVESPIRAGFNATVLRKTAANLSNYWIQQALSGGAYPPHVVESNQEAVDRVSRRVGLIGYVDAEWLQRSAPAGVRTLAVVVKGREASASDPGYSLTY